RFYKKSHIDFLLIDVIRNFGWIEFDPSEDAKMISAIQNIKNVKLSVDNPLYSGIIDSENIISLKPSLLKSLENLEEWKQINSIDLPVKEIMNRHYQERSSLINKSTFTHNILSSIINFISPKIFKHWDQAQSLSAKDCGVRKFGNVIGYITGSDKILYEVFFVEVSYGPFHKDPEPHINEDKIKLGKLGKDSIDRISRLLSTED
ncbi:28901_t:CDS:2, partial [Gigaspora margarita]